MKLCLRTILTPIAALAILYVTPMPASCQQTAAPAAPSAKKDATSAQPARRLADGHPDLNGFWASGTNPDTPVHATFGPNTPDNRQGIYAAKTLGQDPNQPPYKPELMAKVTDLSKFESKYDPAFFCKPGGVPRIGPPHAIVQVPGMPIVFLYQVVSGNTFRLVPTDGRPHDPNADEFYYGDSIGHWEGDTLVVDTIDFNEDTWFGLFGWFHSSKLHVTERISRDGDKLHWQATVEDPEVFTKPWTMNARTSTATKELLVENLPCVETDEGHITNFDEKTKTQ